MPTEPRGAARRRALLEATVRVIGRGGIAAVDHRAVAAEAGVPLGSTTSSFESKGDMDAQALQHVASGGALSDLRELAVEVIELMLTK